MRFAHKMPLYFAYRRVSHNVVTMETSTMGAVHITSLNLKFNGGHFGLPPSSIHRMTGLVAIFRIL